MPSVLEKFSHFSLVLLTALLGMFFVAGVSGVFSGSAFADEGRLPTAWKTSVEAVDGLQKPIEGDSTVIINSLLRENIVPIVKYVFIGVALIFLAMYAYYLSIGMGEEDQWTDQRKNFLFAIIGFTVIGLSAKIVEVIDPIREKNTSILDIEKTESVIRTVITYLEMGLGTIAIAVIFYGALEMIMSDGEEERSGAGKNILKYGFMGLAAVMLAEVLVTKVFYPQSALKGGGIGDTEAEEFMVQGVGVLEFVLQFLAIGVFIAFLISGFLYLTAGDDEEQSDRAKSTLIWTIVGTIVVVISYGILSFFTGNL